MCKNNCLFCFVHNLPQGLRSSLYIRDDDYRLSFLHGNFITLTNVSETDIARIEEQALSPLYVSVHATEPHTRAALMRNPAAAQIMEVMTRLASHGIRFHCQIVVCAGLNDGETLDRTLSDLASLRPAVLSVGVVPVGLTRFCRSEAIRRLNDCEATNLLIQLDAWCRKNRGEQWLFAADELFIQARRRIPPVSYYADFPQLENGIGLVRLFLERAHAVTQPPDRIETPKKVTLVTAPLFYPYLRDFASRYDKVLGLDVEVLSVKNQFFGEMVTVTGLLTATDIYKALAESSARQIIVPDCCQKEGFFLDGLNVVELQSKIRGSVCIVASDPVSLNERILDT